MIILAAVDESSGMMFNHRRQSQDRVLREKILCMTAGKKLWMNAYSAKQFEKDAQITVAEDFLSRAGRGEYCFVEDELLSPYLDRIETVVLFHWNRTYPGDFFFDLDLSDGSWRLEEGETEEFAGSSHEKITKEVYLHG